MGRIAKAATVGALGADTIQPITTRAVADALRGAHVDYIVRYLGSLSSPEIDVILQSSLAVMPVTYSRSSGWQPSGDLGALDAKHHVAECDAIGIPKGATVWLDLEGPGGHAQDVIDHVTNWANIVRGSGYDPGLYCGWGTLLTSEELYQLPVDRYWKSQSRVTDSAGQLAEPKCGWCQYQLFPSVMRGGVWVDLNVIQEDNQTRLPTWVVATP